MSRRRAFLLSLLLAFAGSASAWSDKPVRFIVPGPPGGTSDIVARILGAAVAKRIGQPVVVENKPGAGGGLAVGALLAAQADGSTLLVGPQNAITEVPLVLPVGYDPLRDLKPVAEVGRAGLVLVAGPAAPPGGLKEVIAYARANPGKLAYASYSPGTASHFAGLVLNRQAGTDLRHVPYKGSPPGLNDVMGGQLALMFDGIPTSLALVRSGRLRALAVASAARSPLLPQVPTFAELGYGEVAFANWLGVIASAKVPAAQLERVHAAVLAVLEAPGLRGKLAEAGLEPSPSTTTAALERAVRADHERNARLVRAFDIKAY
jgi:tripartite-type tricarboxylate transporter receptor subunit TctC